MSLWQIANAKVLKTSSNNVWTPTHFHHLQNFILTQNQRLAMKFPNEASMKVKKRNFMPHPHPNRMKMRESELLEGYDGEIMFFCVGLQDKRRNQATSRLLAK